jgi:glycosyltransferase involved in cell wall biosynthesis
MHDRLNESPDPHAAARDFAYQRALLTNSGIFDAESYIACAGEEARPDPVGHYLEQGWRLGLEPNSAFPGSFLQPYFASVKRVGPPAVVWLALRSAGWPMLGTREGVEELAARVRRSGLFSDSYYAAHLPPGADDLDPTIHYVTVGERLGLAPSPGFDSAYYAARNPDVRLAAASLLLHYVEYGRAEGRMPKAADVRTPGRVEFDPNKESVLLVVHETSRSGAPILGWNLAVHLARHYNIFTVRMWDGDLTPEFEALSVEVYGPFAWHRRTPPDLEFSLRGLLDTRKFRYAIVNSAESRLAIEPFVRRFIPTVFLLHEFATYVNPLSQLQTALDWSTEVVFSASVVQQSSLASHRNLATRTTHVIPQGIVTVPPGEAAPEQKESPLREVERLAELRRKDGTFLVLGAGLVVVRKGVDVFLTTAAAVIRKHPMQKFHFLWVGDRYKPKEDLEYSVYLQEQITRSGLTEHVTFLEPVSDLEPIYSIADAFLLTSRLDPLPNVTIDSAVRGIPIVCFRNATGMADLMAADAKTAFGVVDYLDAEAAAARLMELAGNRELRRGFSRALIDLARRHFNMEDYVHQLDTLGIEAAARMEQRRADAQTLADDPTFDPNMFLGPGQPIQTREATIVQYLALGAARGWATLPEIDPFLRRPAPGFHPRIYAAAHSSLLNNCADPFADFIRRGKPAGPWQAPVIRPDDPEVESNPVGRLRAALHAHLFHTELCADLLAHLQSNRSHCDLFITTDTSAKAEELRRKLETYGSGEIDVRVVPNRGRDIGTFLTAFEQDFQHYDLLGHIHAKRSKWGDSKSEGSTWGDEWREFLWQNLIGGICPTMDRIIAAFDNDASLGLVFPADPHLVGWDENLEMSTELAARFGWKGELPEHFDFPLGNMFWIRRAALQPLRDLHLQWSDYPAEPVPYDGTILHALERLSPFACKLAGFHFAVAHIAGLSW